MYGDAAVFNIVHTERIDTMGQLDRWLKRVTSAGGEGLMLRDPDSVWFPKRRPFLLKVKPRHDAEATVIGFAGGKKGKTGQFHGKVGTLICEWTGDPTATCGVLKDPVTFEIGTGLTHEQRTVFDQSVDNFKAHQGKPVPAVTATPYFTVGDRVTFSYMGCTDDNAPREPAYLRKRGEACG